MSRRGASGPGWPLPPAFLRRFSGRVRGIVPDGIRSWG
jgi:hypothetical protein